MTVHSGSSNQMLFKKGECPGLLVRGGDSSLSDWFAVGQTEREGKSWPS